MENSTFSKYTLENFVREYFDLTTPSATNISGIDGYTKTGKIVEIKDLSGSKASLTEKAIEENQDLETQIRLRLKADLYIVYTGNRGTIDISEFKLMNKDEMVEWLKPRIVLDRKSRSTGYKMRFGKNYRSEKATQSLKDKGLL